MPATKRPRVSSQTEPRTLPVWQDILLSYPIYKRICSYLNRYDIVTLAATSKQLHGPMTTLLKSQWDINKLLTRFVNNPVALRQKMADADALISGSFSLQFFDSVVWDDSDLDIYVKGYQWTENGPASLCKHLLEVEDCHLSDTMETEEYEDQILIINGVKTFTRRNSEGSYQNIQIILTLKTPLIMILTSFYTTCLISFISWDCAYHVFPDVTFIKRKTYQLRPMTPFYGNLLLKYARRGWRTLDTVWDDDTEHTKSLLFTGERRVGDSRSWTIPFNTQGILPPHKYNTSNLPYSFFSVNKIPEWVSPTTNERDRARYEVFAKEFDSCVLWQRYTWPRFAEEGCFWLAMGGRMENLTEIEVDKQPEEAAVRVALAGSGLGRYFAFAEEVRELRPEGWTWWDGDVGKWYEAWRKRGVVGKVDED